MENFAYIPDKENFKKLISEKAPENSLAVKKKMDNRDKLTEFRESFENKNEIRNYLEKKLLKFERLKILIFGSYYKVQVKNYEADDIFNNFEKNSNEKFKFFKDYWKQSFLLRRIHGIFRTFKIVVFKIKHMFLGEHTLKFHIMKLFNLEEYYNYKLMTLNERIRYRINYLKNTKSGKKLLEYLDEKYTPLIKDNLKQYILNLSKDKKYKDDLFEWLSKILLTKIEIRDFLLEKICTILLDYFDSPGIDNVIFLYKIKYILL